MSNPLTAIDFRIPFDRVKAEHIEPAVDELLADAQAAVDALAAAAAPPTFANTLLALEEVTERLEYAMTVVGHLESVATYRSFGRRTTGSSRRSARFIPAFR